MPRKRKRSSWGSVAKTGRDAYVLRWWEDAPEGRVRRCETFHGSRREADDRMAEIRVSSSRKAAPTLSYFWNRYYSHDVARLRPNTQKLYLSAWRKAEKTLGPSPVSAITPMMIQEQMDTMGAHAAHQFQGVVKRTLDYAVVLGVISSNPADAPLRLPDKVKEYGKGVYNRGQIDKLLEIVRGSDLEAAFILQGCGGLRVGESLGVMIDEVTKHEGYATVEVRRQILKDGEACRLKTDESERTTLVLDPYATRLCELAAGEHAGGWLTDNGLGGPCSRWALLRRWRWAMKHLPDGMEPIPMRNLRNSYETWMHWEAGIAVDIVSRLMGHRDVKTTLDHYDRPGENTVISRAVSAVGLGGRNAS